MKSRITQLIARYIGVALMGIAGIVAGGELSADSSAQIGELSTAIAIGVVGFLTVVVDLVIHRVNNGGILKAPSDGGRVAPADNVPKPKE